MNFGYGEDQELLRSTTQRFLADNCSLVDLRERLEQPITLDRDVWRAGAGLGWTAMLVPEEHGGGSITDQPVVDLAALAEVLGAGLYPGPVLETNVVARTVARYGNESQRTEHLERIAAGDLVVTWCLSADGRVTPSSVGVTVEPSGDDIVLNGLARFVHDAHVADLLLVTATSDAGPSLVLVPASMTSTRVLGGIDLTRRYCEVRFDGVRVPSRNAVGSVGGATQAIEEALQLATVIQAAESVGVGEQLFERTVEYAKSRVQFGRTIGSFQAIKHRLADLLILVEASRAAARYAALAMADDQVDRDDAVAVAGSYVRDAVAALCSDSLQLHGGIGFTWEHDLHLFLRRAKADQGLYGEPSWHRERLIEILEQNIEVV